ncbi:hypothetical protein LshimejAT787_1802350 [Lyophyllum shimeji]|uniref:C2H2-type domain-containing protein n=1 Tax=Lyophyllum shimeji TaxID=47721 RepID=A0A9P3Q0H2_LYOSH|nr:hypothetical protein LshimejAT787_1802350 [Lyophyllum shimeji]
MLPIAASTDAFWDYAVDVSWRRKCCIMEATKPEVIDLTGLSDSSEEEEDDEDESGDEEHTESSSSRDEDDDIEVPVDGTSRASLHEAIARVSEQRLRQIVAQLVDTFPAVEGALTRELVTLKRKPYDVVPRWETCSNCDEEFDMSTRREEEECMFHPGELEQKIAARILKTLLGPAAKETGGAKGACEGYIGHCPGKSGGCENAILNCSTYPYLHNLHSNNARYVPYLMSYCLPRPIHMFRSDRARDLG